MTLFSHPYTNSSVEATPIEMCRNRTTAGWEWWLSINGERIGGPVGVFTGRDGVPSDVFARLLVRAMADRFKAEQEQ